MKREITGIVKGVYLASDPDTLLSSSQDRLSVDLEGLSGDKHYGFVRPSDTRKREYPRGTPIRNTRQVSIISVEEMREVARRMEIADIQPEWLGANLLFEGIPDLSFLPPSTRLVFPYDAVLVVEGENHPCSGPARIIQDHYPETAGLATAFVKEAMHLRGIVAWVERAGVICPGDIVQARIPEQRIYLAGQEHLEKGK